MGFNLDRGRLSWVHRIIEVFGRVKVAVLLLVLAYQLGVFPRLRLEEKPFFHLLRRKHYTSSYIGNFNFIVRCA